MELIRRFVREDEGAEVVEYALVLGLMAIAAIAAISAAGSAVNNWWQSLADYLNGLAEDFPAAP